MYILMFFHQRNYFLVKIIIKSDEIKLHCTELNIINKKQTKVKIKFTLK